MRTQAMGFVPNGTEPQYEKDCKDRVSFVKAVAEDFAMKRITYEQAKSQLGRKDYYNSQTSEGSQKRKR